MTVYQMKAQDEVNQEPIDFYRDFLDVLEENSIYYCLLGGFAVNCYVDPRESPDMELVVENKKLKPLILTLKKQFKVEKLFYYYKVYARQHSAQARIMTGDRYQPFVRRAQLQNIWDSDFPVASLKDVLKALEWSALDKDTRPDQRKRDLADITRLLAFKPTLDKSLPMRLRKMMALK